MRSTGRNDRLSKWSSCLLLGVAVGSGQAVAQDYPVRPVKLVSPWAPGGANDIFCRALAQKLSESLGQPVVVENRPGAAGTIGSDFVAKAPADGYTLVMGSSPTHSIAPGLYPRLPYDPMRDFTPITLAAVVPNILVVHPSLPIRSVPELIDYAKAHPRQLNFSSTGNGSSQHLFGELFKYLARVDIVHVPYKGTGPALNDLLSGQVQMAFENPPALLPHIQAGRLRALAVAGSKRSASLPDLPTVAEAGLPGYDVAVWFGIFAPAGTPQPVVARLHKDIAAALASPDIKTRMDGFGAEIIGTGPEQFDAHLRAEIPKWAAIIKAANVKVD
ncbi:MFS transporter [Pigmentiphaga sp. NML080357]|nr:MFS transporter [Pigmentiphaga sp. NML080357]